MILLLDNFDSFTYNLVDYFEQLGVKCNVVRNDVGLDNIIKLNPKAIILSPGPQTPNKAGCLMAVINHFHDKVPILGVCLGHQALGVFFGMALVKAPKPMHGKETMVECVREGIFLGIPSTFSVVQYNSLVLKDVISSALQVTAHTVDDQVMAIQHKKLPLTGLQFHPEAALTEYGLQMLKNWLDSNKLKF